RRRREHDETEREREPERRLMPEVAHEARKATRLVGGSGRNVLDEPVTQRLDALPHGVGPDRPASLDRLGREADVDLVDPIELGETALDGLRAARAVHAADLEAER